MYLVSRTEEQENPVHPVILSKTVFFCDGYVLNFVIFVSFVVQLYLNQTPQDGFDP